MRTTKTDIFKNSNKISISHLLPVKNGMDYFPGILNDILKNCDPGDEIVVVDDGSSDSTWEYVQEFFSEYQNFKLLKGDGSGLVDALNLGMRATTRDWVARYDVDDRYPENRIQLQRTAISDKVSVIFSDYQIISDHERKIGSIPSGITNLACCLSLIYSQQTPHPSALINKINFEKAGGYLKNDFPAEDLGLWIRMSRHGSLISIPEILLFYRLSPKGISNSNRKLQISKRKALLKHFASEFKIDFEELERTAKMYSHESNSDVRKLLLIRNTLRYLLLKSFIKFPILPFLKLILVAKPFKVKAITYLIQFKVKKKSTRLPRRID